MEVSETMLRSIFDHSGWSYKFCLDRNLRDHSLNLVVLFVSFQIRRTSWLENFDWQINQSFNVQKGAPVLVQIFL